MILKKDISEQRRKETRSTTTTMRSKMRCLTDIGDDENPFKKN